MPVYREQRDPAVASLSYSTRAINGCRLSWVDANNVTIGAGMARSSADDADILVPAPITVNMPADLDLPGELANTWYFIHVIEDSVGVLPTKGLLSLSHLLPTLPPGYDRVRRLGAVKNNAASAFWRFRQMGEDREREYRFQDDIFGHFALIGAAAPPFTAVSALAQVPLTSKRMIANAVLVGVATGFFFGLAFASEVGATAEASIPATGSRAETAIFDLLLDAGHFFYYGITGGGLTTNVFVIGFKETL